MIRVTNTHDLLGNYARQLDEVKLQLCAALRRPKDCKDTASRLAFEAAKRIEELQRQAAVFREEVERLRAQL